MSPRRPRVPEVPRPADGRGPHENQPRIAVVGMSAIMPDAPDLDAFWRNIAGSVDCVREVPPTHWLLSDHYDPRPEAPDKTYSDRGAFLPEVDFDPIEFGIPPAILPATDPAQPAIAVSFAPAVTGTADACTRAPPALLPPPEATTVREATEGGTV